VISPCVAFNNHDGSTKSYDYVREHNEAVNFLDVITVRREITTEYEPGPVQEVRQHDGSVIRLRKLAEDYDPCNRIAAMNYVQSRYAIGGDRHGLPVHLADTARPACRVEHGGQATERARREGALPRSAALEKLNASLR
jgi:2-oxoglutarate ferredoxin oxidoreductase subunit beta